MKKVQNNYISKNTSFYVHEIEVWLAIISPDTRWEVATYGDFRDNAT